MSRRRPGAWWVHSKWQVETVARITTDRYKAGDWVQIYNAASSTAAKKLASEWEKSTGMKTRISPGPGHPTRRGF